MTNIFEKILYGLKVANDNVVIINDKVDALLKSLTYEEREPNGGAGSDNVGTTVN